MRCPVCNFDDSKVVDSRITFEGFSVRRRRECMECTHRFSTVEEVEILDLALVKRDGRKEMYSRSKLESGLKKALEKRPCESDKFKMLIVSIERDIQKLKKNEVESMEIGEIVMQHLRDFDAVAYIRFASVYRSFADAKTFQDEVAKILLPDAPKKRK